VGASQLLRLSPELLSRPPTALVLKPAFYVTTCDPPIELVEVQIEGSERGEVTTAPSAAIERWASRKTIIEGGTGIAHAAPLMHVANRRQGDVRRSGGGQSVGSRSRVVHVRIGLLLGPDDAPATVEFDYLKRSAGIPSIEPIASEQQTP
jgi:hypothetical protein